MDDADDDGANDLIESESAERPVEPSLRRGIVSVAMIFRAVTMSVAVNIVAVTMRMDMVNSTFASSTRAESLVDPALDSFQVQKSQDDQHQGHGELQREAEARRDHGAEDDHHAAGQNDREGMAKSPEHSDQRCAADRALPADDGGHGDDMIRIRGMPHAEKESKENDGKQS